MPILERIEQQIRARHWTDSIPLEYHYTAGVAGEEFRRELKDNARFLTSKCPKCKTNYLPVRMFCPTCFIETKERTTLTKPGYVYSHTKVLEDKSGNKMSEPVTIALIKFDGVKGGIVHKLEAVAPDRIEIGTKVEPLFQERNARTGALTDIISFIPLGTRSIRPRVAAKRLDAQPEPEKAHLQNLIEMVDESGYPLGEEEAALSEIREKIGRHEHLSHKEDVMLQKIVARAREWRRAEKTSSDTEPENTMSG